MLLTAQFDRHRLLFSSASIAKIGDTQCFKSSCRTNSAVQCFSSQQANFRGSLINRQPHEGAINVLNRQSLQRSSKQTEPSEHPKDRAVKRAGDLISQQDNTQRAGDRHSTVRPTSPAPNGNIPEDVPVPSLRSSSVSTAKPSIAALSHSCVPSMASWNRRGPIINPRIARLRAQASPTYPTALPTSPTAPPTFPIMQHRFEPSSAPVI